MAQFDPDILIPDCLRQRIESWSRDPPRLQFSQYGPINKYLNLKFPTALVKPQGLMRPIVPHVVVEAERGDDDGGADDGGADDRDADDGDADDGESYLEEVGNVSMDSTGKLNLSMIGLLPNRLRRMYGVQTARETVSGFLGHHFSS